MRSAVAPATLIPMNTYRMLLAGYGNVNRSLTGILLSQAGLLQERHGVAFVVIGVADSRGAAADPGGLPLEALAELKRAGKGVGDLPGAGLPGTTALDLARDLDYDLLMEATPVNLETAQPGLDVALMALGRGRNVVLANKGPLALAYARLAALGDLDGTPGKPQMRFSACVGGAMPTINVGRRDYAGARILRIEAILNGTSQGILRMMEQGIEYAAALAEMQRRGLAETDPSLDVEGWDAANKLVIIANAVLRRPTTLKDVAVEGVLGLSADDLAAAQAHGERIVLRCLAEWTGSDYTLSVRPTSLPGAHPLARMSGDEMGIVFETDITGRQTLTTMERDPVPTASAMLRDAVNIVRGA